MNTQLSESGNDIVKACGKCGWIPNGKKEGDWPVIRDKVCKKCGKKLTFIVKEDFISKFQNKKNE